MSAEVLNHFFFKFIGELLTCNFICCTSRHYLSLKFVQYKTCSDWQRKLLVLVVMVLFSVNEDTRGRLKTILKHLMDKQPFFFL